MTTTTPLARLVPRALIMLSVAIAGCESSDDDDSQTGGMCTQTSIENCGPGPWDPFGIALTFAWVGGQCTKEVSCADRAPPTDIPNGIVADDYINANWLVGFVPDREPNDTTDNALPIVFRRGTGVFLEGTVNDATDPADMVAVAIQSANAKIAAYLCPTPQICTVPFLQTNEIYLELYDSAGTLLQTTNMMQTSNGHEIPFLPVIGAGYFVAVRALDTGGADFAYRLNIVD